MTAPKPNLTLYKQQSLEIWEAMFGNYMQAEAGSYVCDYKKFQALLNTLTASILDAVEKEAELVSVDDKDGKGTHLIQAIPLEALSQLRKEVEG